MALRGSQVPPRGFKAVLYYLDELGQVTQSLSASVSLSVKWGCENQHLVVQGLELWAFSARVWVQPLVGELRSHQLHHRAKNKPNQTKQQQNLAPISEGYHEGHRSAVLAQIRDQYPLLLSISSLFPPAKACHMGVVSHIYTHIEQNCNPHLPTRSRTDGGER